MTWFRVFATARSVAKIEGLTAEGIKILELDVTKPEAIAVVRDEVQRRTGGKLNILVNKAYVLGPHLWLNGQTDTLWQRIL